jgi:hypothetical protein
MYAGVSRVKPLKNYRLELTFDTGEVRLFDATTLLSFGRFCELADETTFQQVSVSFDAIRWPNGLDLDPEYLYAASVKQSHSEAEQPTCGDGIPPPQS